MNAQQTWLNGYTVNHEQSEVGLLLVFFLGCISFETQIKLSIDRLIN